MRKQIKTPTRQSEVESYSGNRRRDGRKTTSSKTIPEKKQIRKKVDRKTESSDRSRLKHITRVEKTDASPVSNLCDDQCRGEKLPAKAARKVSSIYVPVVSSTGKPLMPCHPARARQMLKKGKAIKRFTNSIFYIKLVDRADGELQKVACGIDPGSKREGFTVKSSTKTFINVLSETNGFISDKLEVRRNARKSRRFRKTPCRKNKMNRNKGKSFIPPSTRARWNAKLRIVNILRKIYPISDYVAEDIKAKSKKGNKWWNFCFSPLENGKNYFYDEIRKIGKLILMQGYETAAIRSELGLIKTTQKLYDIFEAHNVDSWVLANSIFNIQKEPDNKEIYKFVPILVHRRQLHMFQFNKTGKRKRYGGTVSLGIPKGTVCKYRDEYFSVGGNMKGKLSLNSLVNNKRITNNASLKKIVLMTYIQRWNVKRV
jgi:hypothetical protein